MQSPHISRRKLSCEICTVGKLLLVMPATNAVDGRSFSALRRGKTYLNSTTGESRVNHYMMLHVHEDVTDAPTLVDVANDFVGEKENRKQLFGFFFNLSLGRTYSRIKIYFNHSHVHFSNNHAHSSSITSLECHVLKNIFVYFL